MTLNEYCEYINNALATTKARIVVLPPGDAWTTLRRFCQERGNVELRLSDLITEEAWLPMPDEVFERVRVEMQSPAMRGEIVAFLGLSGYLALLTDEHKRAALVALREWVDSMYERDAVCLLRNDEGIKRILNDVFSNPRYREGKQLIEIATEQAAFGKEAEGQAEVMLVGKKLAPLIPNEYDTFRKYLHYTEEHPNDNSVRRIVVTSRGRELAGLSAEVQQVVCLRDFARVFYEVDNAKLSENALRWMCERGRNISGQTLLDTLKNIFFPGLDILIHALRVFDGHKGAECETLLWLLKQMAPPGSYLKFLFEQEGVTTVTFRSAYVSAASQCLEKASLYADERRTAMQEAGEAMSVADIQRFVVCCKCESTSLVAPWLNCGTAAERAEILRRCAEDGIVSNAVKEVYPETAAYLNDAEVFGNMALKEYFRVYRELKMTNRVTREFYARAANEFPHVAPLRDTIVQQYALDDECALLVVDAMGAEWLPMLVALARERKLGLDSVEIGQAQLPTSTAFNRIPWPDEKRRLQDVKRFDNIVHNGEELHEMQSASVNLAEGLAVIGSRVIPRVSEGLARFKRVLVTADHGSSRLAVLAWKSEPRLALTLTCEEGVNIADWRYRKRTEQGECPAEMEETLDGQYWVVRGYNRLPKKGGGQSFEMHGGATLEERLVPVVIFSRTGEFEPSTVSGRQAQIVEKDDFDL